MQSGLLSGGLNGMKFAGICQEGPPALGALTGVARLYLSRCAAYGVHHPNAGVLTALRHGLRELRVAGGFTDHDMLPLADVLLAGGPLPKSGGAGQGNQVPRAAFSSAFSSGVSSSEEEEERVYSEWCAEAGVSRAQVRSVVKRIERLDFSRSMSKIVGVFRPRLGLRSHGAVSLAKVLEKSDSVVEVRLNRNKIGAYGAAALGRALARKQGNVNGGKQGSSVRVLSLRGCYVGERGARALAEHLICPGIDLAAEFSSRALLDYPDPLAHHSGTSHSGGSQGLRCLCCLPWAPDVTTDPLVFGAPVPPASPATPHAMAPGPAPEQRLTVEGLAKVVEASLQGREKASGGSEGGAGSPNGGGVPWSEVPGYEELQGPAICFPALSSKEGGAVAAQELLIDLSVNAIGWQGLCVVALAAERRRKLGLPGLAIDLDANSVLAEVMNSVTHGVGVLLCLLGTSLLLAAAREDQRLPCAIYSASLVLLYTASTVYHSLFMMNKRVLAVLHLMDKAGIYLLIAGTYTPFMALLEPKWHLELLVLVWSIAVAGICVAALLPPKYERWKPRISLGLYLAMGWSAIVVVEDLLAVLPLNAVRLLIAGGFAYTAGVPLFLRNKNLDHAVWHCFVLTGSACHWFCIYFYLLDWKRQ